jgi:hypothetical protein
MNASYARSYLLHVHLLRKIIFCTSRTSFFLVSENEKIMKYTSAHISVVYVFKNSLHVATTFCEISLPLTHSRGWKCDTWHSLFHVGM